MAMTSAGDEPLVEYFRSIKPGEDVLIEYTSGEPVHMFFHLLLRCLRENGVPVIIVDQLDQLHVFRTQLKLAGVDTELIDTANVIKIGGLLKTGKVLGRVDLSKEFPIRKKHYEEALKKVDADYTVRIVLGFDKVLAMHEVDRKDLESLFGYMIRPYLGDERRTTVYFINTELFTERTLKELREHASRVFRVRFEENAVVLKVIKSPNVAEYGKEMETKIEDCV
ncbi:DUF257 family protein [Thermococcus radiotolerans]|uniref:KaiC-like domain-containing protein n=1 Tax=Thermococcus radiotolerans TaxID=187880 RepID=A0A2Z2MV96_9EURY|nr:DUF257 family protein [Thermococcus radiotolerans]ASJ13865.1 hypothetical protein A3L10_01465 [Thermococcus radiotolerans]